MEDVMNATVMGLCAWSRGTVSILTMFMLLQWGGIASALDGAKDIPCDVPDGKNVADAQKDAARASRLITGEVMQMNGDKYVVKQESGEEVRIQITDRTEKPDIYKGDMISVSLDNSNHALWIRSNRSTDRRTEHASADCNPAEEVSSETLKKAAERSGKGH
jgi:hypothetical protein